MPKEVYSKAFAAALVTAGSIIGPIIPPSVIMVLCAAVADVSVLRLFLDGVVPGLLLGLACATVVIVKGMRGGLPRSSMMVNAAERPRALREGLLVLTLPGFIIFGTLSGVFTPTEAGGIAVIYGIFLGMSARACRRDWRDRVAGVLSVSIHCPPQLGPAVAI